MTTNPLEDTPERTARIKARARHLWEEDGKPAGAEAEYEERARELVGMEESAGAGQLPNPELHPGLLPGVTVEEASIQENLGEFADRFTDQGDRRETPMTREELHAFRSEGIEPSRGDADG